MRGGGAAGEVSVVDIGKKLAEYRSDITARAFRASRQRLRGT
jgi:hypothetical protein